MNFSPPVYCFKHFFQLPDKRLADKLQGLKISYHVSTNKEFISISFKFQFITSKNCPNFPKMNVPYPLFMYRTPCFMNPLFFHCALQQLSDFIKSAEHSKTKENRVGKTKPLGGSPKWLLIVGQ